MTDYNYIHQDDEMAMIHENYKEAMSFLEDCELDLQIMNCKRSGAKMFNEYTEELEMTFLESGDNIVKKLGQKIIDMINRCKKFIAEKVTAIKNLGFKWSSDEKKINKAIQKNPALADDIKIAISNGNLKVSDVKDLKTFYNEVESIMDAMKKDSVDPKSLKGRFEKAKKMVSKNATTIAAVLGVISTATVVYLNWTKIKSVKKGIDMSMDDTIKHSDTISRKMAVQANALQNIVDGDPSQMNASKLSLICQMKAEEERLTTGYVSTMTNVKACIAKGLDKIANRLPGKNRGTKAYDTISSSIKVKSDNASLERKIAQATKTKDDLKHMLDTFNKTTTKSTIQSNLRGGAKKTSTTTGLDTQSYNATYARYKEVSQELAALRQQYNNRK